MGDFDEYEYLEKAVEEPEQEHPKEKEHRSSRHHEKDGEVRERERERDRSSRSDRREKDRDQRSSRDDERAREKDREHRSRDGDGHKERAREKKDRDREKEREKDSDRDRDRDKDRDKDKERDRERRSSSRSKRHEREAEREMERARSRDRALREKELERELREKESRRFKDKKDGTEPEADPERDQRTVFAYQMPLKATERDVYEFFSQVGKVRDVRLIMDRNSRRSKGVGYIEFYDAMSVPNAIALSGHLLLGQPVMVKPSEAEKNLVQSNTAGATGTAGAAALRKLYVGNLHFSITEEQLRQIFEPFGPVELVQLPLDLETGQCRGYGFVQFAQLEHAKAAQSLNGKLDIAGRIIKVSAVTDHVGVQDPGANAADFDDEDGGALALNARSRAILMQKLDRTGTASSIAESLGVPVLNGTVPNQVGFGLLPVNGQPAVPAAVPGMHTPIIDPIGEPSECILLKNMFDPSTETEPDFELDIKDDVQEECSKFGPLRHIYVDKNSNGFVYLQFENMLSAAGCQRAMHGRWFAGRSISATYMRPADYEAKFKGSM